MDMAQQQFMIRNMLEGGGGGPGDYGGGGGGGSNIPGFFSDNIWPSHEKMEANLQPFMMTKMQKLLNAMQSMLNIVPFANMAPSQYLKLPGMDTVAGKFHSFWGKKSR
jgi:hypothetical protein